VNEGAARTSRTLTGRRLLYALWAGVAIQLAGGAVDGIWHAGHDGFESASDQLEAHWLIWVGMFAAVAVSALGVTRERSRVRLGYWIVLASSGGYIAVAIWHFLEHAAHRDAAPAHILLALTWAAVVLGAYAFTFASRRLEKADLRR
jgi:drug/metabolite transporter (DMT)-like permease